MTTLETKNYEMTNESLETNAIFWKLKDLAWEIVWKATKKDFGEYSKKILGKDQISNTDACALCAKLDKADTSKLNEKNKKTWDLIVNNRRWDTFQEMFNANEKNRKDTRELFEEIA